MKTTACVPCEEKLTKLPPNILAASVCEIVYQLMTIEVPPSRPTSLLILGSRCCISDSDGAISPTVSSVSTAYPVSLGCVARRSPGSSTSAAEPSPSPAPLRLEAGVANRDIVSSHHRLGRPRVAENEQEKPAAPPGVARKTASGA